jgi:hypothetical protein
VRHGDLMFCFIYKFRQHFAVIANAIAREQSVRLATGLMARQAIAATVFSTLLAWGDGWLAR